MPKSQKNYAEDARRFVALQRCGVLVTKSVTNPEFPFASIVPYDVDSRGQIVIYISLIAEHYRNIVADSASTLFIADWLGVENAQAHARATIFVRWVLVPAEDCSAVSAAYEGRFPESVDHSIAHNFVFYRAAPERIRWIGGFGDIGWVSKEAYQSAELDSLAYGAMDIIAHMNEDHGDALCDLAQAHAGGGIAVKAASMVDLDSAGFSIRYVIRHQVHTLRLEFPQTCATPEEVRGAMIRMLREVRE